MFGTIITYVLIWYLSARRVSHHYKLWMQGVITLMLRDKLNNWTIGCGLGLAVLSTAASITRIIVLLGDRI